MFKQTLTHFLHFILYHIPQLAWYFYGFFSFEYFDLFDQYAAFWFPLTVTLKIVIKPLQNCIVVLFTLFLTYFSHIVCPYRDKKEIYSRGSLQFKSHNEDCLFVCYGSLTSGQLFRALARLPQVTLEIKFASCPAGGQNCGQWGSHKIISFG